jgi:hypothetical protein
LIERATPIPGSFKLKPSYRLVNASLANMRYLLKRQVAPICSGAAFNFGNYFLAMFVAQVEIFNGYLGF